MMEPFCAPGKSLMKDGAWIVPESERPANWRDITMREELPVACDKDIETPISEAKEERFVYPLPPPKYNPVFLPIFQGLQKGLEARKELLELTQYCMALEVALEEQDIKRIKI